jgi:hypothetical protein
VVSFQVPIEVTAETINRGLFGVIAVCLTAFAHLANRIYNAIDQRIDKIETKVVELGEEYTELRVLVGALPDRRRHTKED